MVLVKGFLTCAHNFTYGLSTTAHWLALLKPSPMASLGNTYLKFYLTYLTILLLALGIMTASTIGLIAVLLIVLIGPIGGTIVLVTLTPSVVVALLILWQLGRFPTALFSAGEGLLMGYTSLSAIAFGVALLIGGTSANEFIVVGLEAMHPSSRKRREGGSSCSSGSFHPGSYPPERLELIRKAKCSLSRRLGIILFVTLHEVFVEYVFVTIVSNLPILAAATDNDSSSTVVSYVQLIMPDLVAAFNYQFRIIATYRIAIKGCINNESATRSFLNHFWEAWTSVFLLLGFGLPLQLLRRYGAGLSVSVIARLLEAMMDLGLAYVLVAAVLPDLEKDGRRRNWLSEDYGDLWMKEGSWSALMNGDENAGQETTLSKRFEAKLKILRENDKKGNGGSTGKERRGKKKKVEKE